jgi:hypothetical protein
MWPTMQPPLSSLSCTALCVLRIPHERNRGQQPAHRGIRGSPWVSAVQPPFRRTHDANMNYMMHCHGKNGLLVVPNREPAEPYAADLAHDMTKALGRLSGHFASVSQHQQGAVASPALEGSHARVKTRRPQHAPAMITDKTV